MAGVGRDEFERAAIEQPFDNSSNGFIADNTQEAIEELKTQVEVSASPGFTWGKSGNVSSNTWLENDTVASNRTGRTVPVTNGEITDVFVAVEEDTTCDIEFYKRYDCNDTWLFIGSVALTNECTRSFSGLSVPVAYEEQIAVRLGAGSAKNPVVGLIIRGETVGGGGSARDLEILDDAMSIETATTEMNFTGAGVIVTSSSAGAVEVNIPGGGAGSGESNTASNVGDGANIFKQKTGIDLEFRGVKGVSGLTSIVNGDNVEIQIEDQDINKVTYGVDVAGGTDVTAGWTDITLDTKPLEAAAIVNFTAGTATMTVIKTGLYEVGFGTSLEQNGGNNRSQAAMRLVLDTGSGFTQVPGSYAEMYSRNNGFGGDNAFKSVPMLLTAGDVVKMQGQRVAGPGTILVVPNSSVLWLKYIRSAN